MIFAMTAQELGNIRTQGNDLEMFGAREIEGGARQLRGDSMALEWRGNFRVLDHDAVGEPAIGDEREKPVHGGFKAVSRFVVNDRDGVQV